MYFQLHDLTNIGRALSRLLILHSMHFSWRVFNSLLYCPLSIQECMNTMLYIHSIILCIPFVYISVIAMPSESFLAIKPTASRNESKLEWKIILPSRKHGHIQTLPIRHGHQECISSCRSRAWRLLHHFINLCNFPYLRMLPHSNLPIQIQHLFSQSTYSESYLLI